MAPANLDIGQRVDIQYAYDKGKIVMAQEKAKHQGQDKQRSAPSAFANGPSKP